MSWRNLFCNWQTVFHTNVSQIICKVIMGNPKISDLLIFVPPASRPQNRVQIFRRTPMASQSSRFAFSHFQREATDRVNRLPKLRTPHDNQCDNNTELISSLLFELSCVALVLFPS